MGYDLGEKTYTYFQTHSNGEGGFSRGTIDGDIGHGSTIRRSLAVALQEDRELGHGHLHI